MTRSQLPFYAYPPPKMLLLLSNVIMQVSKNLKLQGGKGIKKWQGAKIVLIQHVTPQNIWDFDIQSITSVIK